MVIFDLIHLMSLGVKLGVVLTMSRNDDETFVRKVASTISSQLLFHPFLFVVATTGTASVSPSHPRSTDSDSDTPQSQIETAPSTSNRLVVVGSSETFVQRAILLVSSKFIGRIEAARNELTTWTAVIRDIATSSYDEKALWDVIRKAARKPINPRSRPPGSRSIDTMLSDARAHLQRLTPQDAYEELNDPDIDAPTFLVDIRPAAQRASEGGIHGSLIIERNVLEWRFDPQSDSRLDISDRYDLRIIVFCQEGYTSSLAAFALHELGLLNATDIIGGYRAWKEAGLPIDRPYD